MANRDILRISNDAVIVRIVWDDDTLELLRVLHLNNTPYPCTITIANRSFTLQPNTQGSTNIPAGIAMKVGPVQLSGLVFGFNIATRWP